MLLQIQTTPFKKKNSELELGSMEQQWFKWVKSMLTYTI